MNSPLPKGPQLVEVIRVIPAGKTSRVDVPGTFFRVKEATYGFRIGLDDTPTIEWDLGLQYVCPAGESFNSLTVENTLGEELSITILIGRGNIQDDRLNVIERRNGSAPSTVPPTFAEVGTIAAVASGHVKLADANPNRAKLIVYRDNEFILTPSATTEAGMPSSIQGGSYFFAVIDTKGEVWGFDVDGATSDFRVAETTF